MTLAFLFWLIFVLLILFGILGAFPAANTAWPYWWRGWGLLVLVLIFLLGWRVFGFIIQG